MTTLATEIAEAFVPLCNDQARYLGAWGGRGGGKSRFFGRRLVTRAFGRPTRAVCLREVQLSIRDSVHQLLEDEIQRLGLGKSFNVLEHEIRGPRDSLITFRGMSKMTAESIKSLEAFDIAWVEEGQSLSERSWGLLRPTIRNEGSQIWCSWNPRYRTDAVDKFFRKNPPPDAVVQRVLWSDNPWFPDVLRRELEHDYATDREMAEHVWGGGYSIDHGAILARYLDRIERAGFINDDVEFDENGPGVEIVHDIGIRDATAAWFVQRRVGGLAILDFDSATGLEAREWIDRLKERLERRHWPLGRIWLPHDARNKTFRSSYTVMEIFLTAFGMQNVAMVPQATLSDQVNAARLTVPRCEFHATRCADGLEELRSWQYEVNEETQLFSKAPQHSDTGSAFCYVAVSLQNLRPPPPPKKPEPMRGVGQLTVDEVIRLTGTVDRRWA